MTIKSSEIGKIVQLVSARAEELPNLSQITASYATISILTASCATVTNQLGIGTVATTRALQVDDPASAISAVIDGPGGWTYAEGSFSTNANLYLSNTHTDNTAGLATSIVLRQSGTSKNRFAGITLVGGSNHGGNLVFLTRTSDGVYAERMRINESGDLQFGATAGAAGGIAQESWTDVLPFSRGASGVRFYEYWDNYETSGYEDVGYMKDSMGFVHLRGLAQSADDPGAASTIFALPAGYRPANTRGFAVPAQDSNSGKDAGGIYVKADGTVVATWGWADPGWIFLDGIIFDTR